MRANYETFVCALAAVFALPLCAQDLAPRAYVITPVRSNAVILTWSFFDGGVNFNGAVPIANATETFSIPIFSVYHSFGFFGRSANVTASLPYGVGTFQGELASATASSDLSLWAGGLFRALFGESDRWPSHETARIRQMEAEGPARCKLADPPSHGTIRPHQDRQLEYQSLGVQAGIRLFRTVGKLGTGRICRHLVLHHEPEFGPVGKPQNEGPIGAFEGHLSHYFKPGTWASLDGNFWWGGLTSLSGIQNLKTKQVGSRIGGTAAWRFSKHQALKASYSTGTYSRFGGNYQNVSVAWQYSWLGLPKKK